MISTRKNWLLRLQSEFDFNDVSTFLCCVAVHFDTLGTGGSFLKYETWKLKKTDNCISALHLFKIIRNVVNIDKITVFLFGNRLIKLIYYELRLKHLTFFEINETLPFYELLKR